MTHTCHSTFKVTSSLEEDGSKHFCLICSYTFTAYKLNILSIFIYMPDKYKSCFNCMTRNDMIHKKHQAVRRNF